MSDNKMVGRPVKFRILELLADGEELWNYEIVNTLMTEYNGKSNFQRDSFNFDLVEVAASGFIVSVDSKIDEDGSLLREGTLLSKYKITAIGKGQYDDLVVKTSKKKEA